jgi:hypothetical protein
MKIAKCLTTHNNSLIHKEPMVMDSLDNELRKGIVLYESKKFPREYIEIPLLYSIRDDEDYPDRVGEFIEGGILVYVRDNLDIGTNLDIEIFPPEYFGLKSIKAVTQIVWTQLQATNDEEEHEYGLKFMSMDSSNILRLRKLLNHLEPE